ncbi:MAG: bifunctional phosphopantothenoylcysteine decarboxylase/phosphopantothenate--cysteine ligase CoaBC [Deltaproteobacteria bacterium]|jgi:phosphopantothenoylcysteine decarboxylase/phosphopantothenate--cysteine ligase|nr:bifunctional phosphopantothenoylcysteine decarboxylase/phosphopantothenate--cysteine ligase CoaBC [Deltaproteobacteria bacterium]
MLKSDLKTSNHILFIFTGSIACYKAVNVVSKLAQEGHQVQCVMTPSASQFIGTATLEGLTGIRVHTSVFEEGQIMGHIKLIRDADIVVVAPATANFINKISAGIADDLASTLFLAHDFKKPFILFPAMNSSMYHHPVTQKSMQNLAAMGITISSTGSGILACGEVGYGKLLEPELILTEIKKTLKGSSRPKKFLGTKSIFKNRILITGGGTQEKIDSVRFITNASTGSTSIKMAEFFTELGFQVTLLLSERVQEKICSEISLKKFSSFRDLNSSLKFELKNSKYDFVFHAAAVSDFSVKEIRSMSRNKSKSKPLPFPTIKGSNKIESNEEISLVLEPNFKIISKLKTYSSNKKVKIIGFKLTDSKLKNVKDAAVKKLLSDKNVDYVIHNDLHEISTDKTKHAFSLWDKKTGDSIPCAGIANLNTLVVNNILFGEPL